jgi:hypothetical protein
MTTKPVHVPPGTVTHAIDPRTGKPFANVIDQISYGISEQIRRRTALHTHLYYRSKRNGR